MGRRLVCKHDQVCGWGGDSEGVSRCRTVRILDRHPTFVPAVLAPMGPY